MHTRFCSSAVFVLKCVWQLSKCHHGSVAIGLVLVGHSLNLAVQDALTVKKVKLVLE